MSRPKHGFGQAPGGKSLTNAVLHSENHNRVITRQTAHRPKRILEALCTFPSSKILANMDL